MGPRIRQDKPTPLILPSFYVCGTIIQFITSLPSVSNYKTGLAGLSVAMILVGAGVGGTKAAIVPFIGIASPIDLYITRVILTCTQGINTRSSLLR